MKKAQLLSKTEMKNVMGGQVPPSNGCLMECEAVGSHCGVASNPGICTHFAASPGCPDGENLCVAGEA